MIVFDKSEVDDAALAGGGYRVDDVVMNGLLRERLKGVTLDVCK